MMEAKFELAFTRYQHNLKTGGNLMVINSLGSPENLMLRNGTSTLRTDQRRLESV